MQNVPVLRAKNTDWLFKAGDVSNKANSRGLDQQGVLLSPSLLATARLSCHVIFFVTVTTLLKCYHRHVDEMVSPLPPLL